MSLAIFSASLIAASLALASSASALVAALAAFKSSSTLSFVASSTLLSVLFLSSTNFFCIYR